MNNLNSIPKSGSYGDGVDLHNDNYQKIGVELQTLRELRQNEKGYFEDLSSLQSKYPTPQSGWQAYVKDAGSSTGYYVANVNSSGAWVVTGAEAPPINVDLAGYAKTGGSTKTVKEVEDEIVQLAGENSKIDKQIGLFENDSKVNLLSKSLINVECLSALAYKKIEITRLINKRSPTYSTYMEANVTLIDDSVEEVVGPFVNYTETGDMSYGQCRFPLNRTFKGVNYSYVFHFDFLEGDDVITGEESYEGLTIRNSSIIREYNETARRAIAASNLELIDSGENFTPEYILNSEYSNSDIWIDGSLLLSNNTLSNNQSFFTLKEALTIEHTGSYRFKTNISGNARILIFDQLGNIKKSISVSERIEQNTYLINVKGGDQIRWCCSKNAEFPISSMTIENAEPLITDTGAFAHRNTEGKIVKANENIIALNDEFGYIPKGYNLIQVPIDPEDLHAGYININTGEEVTGTYWTTPHIKIPINAKLRVTTPLSASSALNYGLYLYNDGEYIEGFNRNSEYFDSGIFTFPENFFSERGYTLRALTFHQDLRDLSLETYASSFSNINRNGQIASSGGVMKFELNTDLSIPHQVYNEDNELDESAIGDPNSKTVVHVNLTPVNNIRFKFRITEDLYKSNKDAVLFKVNGIELKATRKTSRQATSTYEDEGEIKTSYLPYLVSGLMFNGYTSANHLKAIHGEFAFSVKYTGDVENEVTIENTGSEFIVRENGTTIGAYDFSSYPMVSDLYDALRNTVNIEVDYIFIERRMSEEIISFPELKLTSNFMKQSTIVRDAAKVYIPYAVNNDWHQVEIVTFKGIAYLAVNGIVSQYPSSNLTGDVAMQFGGNCGILFKDIEIDPMTNRDAEIVLYKQEYKNIISSVNPLPIIFIGHGMDDSPSMDVTSSSTLDVTPDRLQAVFDELRKKGYHPVSLSEIQDYYHNGKSLPKRCYTLVFDDFEFQNYLNLKNRSVFIRNSVKPVLAINTGNYPGRQILNANGEPITISEACKIGSRCGFDFIMHTRDHRRITDRILSQYEEEFLMDMMDADRVGIRSDIIAYPYGAYDYYVSIALNAIGVNMGIRVSRQGADGINRKATNPYYITREVIAQNHDINDVLKSII